MDSSLPPVETGGIEPLLLAIRVRAIGQMLSNAYDDPQPEALARLHRVVAILDRVSRQ